jgi:hypothetical protein
MESFKIKLPEGITHYLIGENTTPLIDVLVFENSITIQEHTGGNTYRLTLDKEKSTLDVLSFTTRTSNLMSYLTYQVDIMVDISGTIPIFALCSGIPILWLFNDTYILRVR